jgi:hypothetical protein
VERTIGLRKLDVGTWFHTAIGLAEYFRPFLDTYGHSAEVNEIEYSLDDSNSAMVAALRKRCFASHILMDMSTPTQRHQPRICCATINTSQSKKPAERLTSSEEPCLAGVVSPQLYGKGLIMHTISVEVDCAQLGSLLSPIITQWH